MLDQFGSFVEQLLQRGGAPHELIGRLPDQLGPTQRRQGETGNPGIRRPLDPNGARLWPQQGAEPELLLSAGRRCAPGPVAGDGKEGNAHFGQHGLVEAVCATIDNEKCRHIGRQVPSERNILDIGACFHDPVRTMS